MKLIMTFLWIQKNKDIETVTENIQSSLSLQIIGHANENTKCRHNTNSNTNYDPPDAFYKESKRKHKKSEN